MIKMIQKKLLYRSILTSMDYFLYHRRIHFLKAYFVAKVPLLSVSLPTPAKVPATKKSLFYT